MGRRTTCTHECGGMTMFAFTRHTGVRIAEIGFAFMAIAGVLLAVAPVRRVGTREAVAGGIALVIGAVIVLVAIRWGSFGAYDF